MTLIDGKAISEQVKQEIAAEVAEIVAHGGKRPHLAAILVGHDGGSETCSRQSKSLRSVRIQVVTDPLRK